MHLNIYLGFSNRKTFQTNHVYSKLKRRGNDRSWNEINVMCLKGNRIRFCVDFLYQSSGTLFDKIA